MLPESSGSHRQAASPPPILDDIDQRLLHALRADARQSMSALAQAVGIARATAYTRVERLVSSGVISRFTIDVDPAKLGRAVTALITVRIEQHAWRALRAEFAAMPEVDYVALTTGDFDMMLVVRAASTDILRDVVLVRLQAMPDVRSTRTIFVLDEVRTPSA
jgi:DNA-binding Lrp family transcriptional regulator